MSDSKKTIEHLGNFLRFLHSATTNEMTGQFAGLRLNNSDTVGAQYIKISESGRMRHHIEVHCRGNKHRSLSREISRDKHIVGHSRSHFSERTSSCRGDNHSIGPEPNINVRMPFTGIGGEEIADDRFARKS